MRFLERVFLLQCWIVLNVKAARQGTVLFMRAGTNMSLSELFYSSNHTDTTNLDKHLWGIEYLMNGSNFRSPILDNKDELNLTKYDVIAYNAAGEVMTTFQFDDGINGYTSTAGMVEFSELYHSTSLSLFGKVDTDKGRFVSIHVQSSRPIGSQFIFSTDEGFNDLPIDANTGCYRFTASSLFVSLSDTFNIESGEDCVRYCVTVPESFHAIAFTMNKSNTISHRCACLQTINSAISIHGQYNVTSCPDETACGCTIYSEGDTHVFASVYSMINTNQFLDELTRQTTASYTFVFPTSYPYILQVRRYVTEVRFTTSPHFTYTLGLADTSDCGSGATFSFYGQHTGSVKIFNASIHETIHPTPATCLYINILTNGTTGIHDAQITYLTDTFTTAEYLQIVGHWTKVECEMSEVLHNSSIIQENWINVVQMNFPSSLMYGNNITFPEMSRNVMTINVSLNESRFFVVRNISFMSDVDAVVVTTFNTNNTCVELNNGTKLLQQYNKSFALDLSKNTLKTITVPIICAYYLSFDGRVQKTTGSVFPRVYHVQFTIYGCVLAEPFLNAPCGNEDITSQLLLEANVSWIWVTNQSTASSYLRPGGPGVVLYRYADPYIRIQLDDKPIPIEVKRVRITGDIIQGVVTIGGVEKFLDNTTGPILDFRFTNEMRGNEIKIDQIFGRTDLNHDIYDFLIIKVAVAICPLSLDTVNSSKNTTANLTQQSTQNSSMSTSVTSGNTFSGQIQHSSSTHTPSGQNTTLQANMSSPTVLSTPTSPFLTAPNTSTSAVPPNTTNASITITSRSSATNVSTSLSSPNTTTAQHTSSPTNASSTTALAPSTSTTPPLTSTTSTSTITTTSTTTTTLMAQTSTSKTTSTTTPALTKPTSTSTQPTTPSTTSTTPPTTSPTSSHQQTVTTESVTEHHYNASTTSLPANPPTQQTSSCCVCFNDSLNITQEEIDTLVQQLVRNLTVPKRKTSAFKRSKESAPDERTSAKMVGTVGIAMMTVTAALIVAMDYTYIVQIIKFGLHHLRWKGVDGKKIRAKFAGIYRGTVVVLLMINFIFSLGEFSNVKNFDAVLLNNIISSIWFLQVTFFSLNNAIRCTKWDLFYSAWDSFADEYKIDTRSKCRRTSAIFVLCYLVWILVASAFLGFSMSVPRPPSGFMVHVPEEAHTLVMSFIIIAYFYFVSTWFLLTSQFTSVCVFLCRLLWDLYRRIKKYLDKGTICEEIEKLRLQHDKICNMTELADHILCVFVMVTVFSTIPLIVLTLYYVLFQSHETNPFTYFATWWSISLSTLQLCVILFAGGALNYVAHKPSSLLYRVDLTKASTHRALQLSVFLNRLTNGQPIGLTAVGLFVLDKPTIITFVGSIMTYAIVVIQFKPGESNYNLTCNCTV